MPPETVRCVFLLKGINKAKSYNTDLTTQHMLKQTYLFEGPLVFAVLFLFKALPDAGAILWVGGLRAIRREERRPFLSMIEYSG